MLPVSQFLFELQLLISPVVSSNFAIAVLYIFNLPLSDGVAVKIRTFFLTGTQLSTLLFIPGKDSPREYPSLPSPRRISNELFSAKGRKLFSYRNTVQLMAWGQFLAHDCGARCAHLFYFSVLCLLFVCLRIVSCVPNVASVSVLIRITASG
jgi:hypothetical protein